MSYRQLAKIAPTTRSVHLFLAGDIKIHPKKDFSLVAELPHGNGRGSYSIGRPIRCDGCKAPLKYTAPRRFA